MHTYKHFLFFSVLQADTWFLAVKEFFHINLLCALISALWFQKFTCSNDGTMMKVLIILCLFGGKSSLTDDVKTLSRLEKDIHLMAKHE